MERFVLCVFHQTFKKRAWKIQELHEKVSGPVSGDKEPSPEVQCRSRLTSNDHCDASYDRLIIWLKLSF